MCTNYQLLLSNDLIHGLELLLNYVYYIFWIFIYSFGKMNKLNVALNNSFYIKCIFDGSLPKKINLKIYVHLFP